MEEEQNPQGTEGRHDKMKKVMFYAGVMVGAVAACVAISILTALNIVYYVPGYALVILGTVSLIGGWFMMRDANRSLDKSNKMAAEALQAYAEASNRLTSANALHEAAVQYSRDLGIEIRTQ